VQGDERGKWKKADQGTREGQAGLLTGARGRAFQTPPRCWLKASGRPGALFPAETGPSPSPAITAQAAVDPCPARLLLAHPHLAALRHPHLHPRPKTSPLTTISIQLHPIPIPIPHLHAALVPPVSTPTPTKANVLHRRCARLLADDPALRTQPRLSKPHTVSANADADTTSASTNHHQPSNAQMPFYYYTPVQPRAHSAKCPPIRCPSHALDTHLPTYLLCPPSCS
jgi:hypothetical protein